MWRVFDQPIGTFVYFFWGVVRILNKRLLRADPCCRSVINEFAHAFSCAYIEYNGCTWEAWRALRKLELISATPRATPTHFSCSPNFPRAFITRYTHAKHEQILNFPSQQLKQNQNPMQETKRFFFFIRKLRFAFNYKPARYYSNFKQNEKNLKTEIFIACHKLYLLHTCLMY